MSPFRTSLSPRTSNKIKFAVSGAALALAATAGGTIIGLSASAPAKPVASGAARTQVHGARQVLPQRAVARFGLPASALAASQHTATANRRQTATLDAFTARKAQATAASRRRHRRLTPRQIARQMLGTFHWARWQFYYLNLLWSRESSWNVYASNPYSGAYGIPQAVPGSKMSSAGPSWWSSARTQIRWGMRYIKSVYGSPKAAWDHEVATGWY